MSVDTQKLTFPGTAHHSQPKYKITDYSRLSYIIGNLKNASNAVLCKEYVSEEVEGERKRYVEIISSHLSKN